MLHKYLTDHPHAIGETYGEHAGHAFWIGLRLILSGAACMVHAIVPGLFVRTASNTVTDIQDRMLQRNRAHEPAHQA